MKSILKELFEPDYNMAYFINLLATGWLFREAHWVLGIIAFLGGFVISRIGAVLTRRQVPLHEYMRTVRRLTDRNRDLVERLRAYESQKNDA